MSKRIKNTTGQMYYLNAVADGKHVKKILRPNAELSVTDGDLEILQKASSTKNLFGGTIEVLGSNQLVPTPPVPKPKVKPKAKPRPIDPVNG